MNIPSPPPADPAPASTEDLKGRDATLNPLLNRLLAGAVTLLVLGVIVGAFSLFHLDGLVEQLELKSYDLRTQMQLHWGNSPRRPDENIIILQFDDLSLNTLSDEFGLWPWPRDVHARMIRYMNSVGVRRLLYDIMFVAHRKGDERNDWMLVDAFRRYRNVYLSMNLDHDLDQHRKLGKDLRPQDIELLRPLSIPLRSELDRAPRNTFLHLRRDPDGTVFFDNDNMTFNHYRSIMPELLSIGRNIGIINHGADEDGVSRSNPLFFRFCYQPFVKTTALPLRRKTNGHWYDADGQRTDADGYLLQRSAYPAVTSRKDGILLDGTPGNPQIVDREGYLINEVGQPIYRRELKSRSLYFPYLGLRAVLDIKYPHQTPLFLLTADGRLKFGSYDIPLRADGSTLLTWYNVNLVREEQQKVQQNLTHYIDILHSKILELEQEQAQGSLQGAPAARLPVRRIGQALLARRLELQRAETLWQRLEQTLKLDSAPQPYRTVSAWEVIRAMRRAEAGLPLTLEDRELQRRLRNKTVFVGTTAVATYDIKNTSIYSALPGVILQATLFDNLNRNDGHYVQRATPSANLWITLFICLLAAGLTFRIRSALVGILTTINIGVLYVLLAITLYQYASLWVNIAMPLIALIVTTTLTFIAKYILRDKDYEKTYALATTDSMTGLYNHRFFQESIHQSIEQASRLKQPFSLLLIDIDLFKRFNDTYGHQAGDEVLRHVARKLQKTVRSRDVVARYGGEEIAIILAQADEAEAVAVAQKIVRAVAEEACPVAEGVTRNVTVSCGVATYPQHGGTPSQLIEVADAGLYRAKKNGRNQVGALPAFRSGPAR